MYDCVVVGAGPGGIVCAKELLENGVDNLICLEQEACLGGTFSKAYDHLTLTSSAVMSMYSDFWIGDEYRMSIWNKSEAVAYWKRYAAHFGVLDKIRFNTRVNKAHEENGVWHVGTGSGEELLAKRLVVATGNNSVVRYPEWKKAISSTKVLARHSHDYVNADAYRGQRVLVVGGGESGTDIALEISKVAAKCWISLRGSTGWLTPHKRGEMPADIATHRGLWGLPRSHGVEVSKALIEIEKGRRNPLSDAAAKLNLMVTNRLGVFGIYGTKSFALPIAMVEHGCELVDEVVGVDDGGRRLSTKQGKWLEDVDVIIFCTGYTNHLEFLPEDLQSINPRSLYRHMFHPDLGLALTWFGWARPNFGSQFPVMEMQARYFAQLCKGTLVLPPKAAMINDIDRCKRQLEAQFEQTASAIPSLVDYRIYMDDMAEMLGCTPPFWRLFFFENLVWRKVLFGALQGTQFRLIGPGAKPKIARNILAKCPHLAFSHKLVKLGIRGRLKQLFFAWRY